MDAPVSPHAAGGLEQLEHPLPDPHLKALAGQPSLAPAVIVVALAVEAHRLQQRLQRPAVTKPLHHHRALEPARHPGEGQRAWGF